MRPAGEVRLALLRAATEHLEDTGRGATLQELAARACVGHGAARTTVRHMKREGKLKILDTRRVAYRNRPVAEYAPAVADVQEPAVFDLGSALALWAA